MPAHGILRPVNPANLRDRLAAVRWSVESAREAVFRAVRAFPGWAGLSPGRRVMVLKAFRQSLKRRKGLLAETITRETGKSIRESKEESELLLSKIDFTIESAAAELNRRPAGPGAYCVYRPYGVAVVLGPFNFPLHLPHGHIVPALLAGNTVVFKPSDKASWCGRLYAECAAEAGFPPGVVNVVPGPAAVGECLAAHPAVSMVLFTGSYAVGRRIQDLTRDQPDKLLALEMGGKNAAVVFKDSDLTEAAAECARAAFATAGQRCTSTSRIFVHASVMDSFCDRFVSIASRLPVGDPTDPEIFCGPLISESSARRAESARREARRLGGTPLLSGGRFDPARGHFVRLSAHRFKRYPGRCRYTAEELFIPEVGIYPFTDIEEAVERVEDTDYGLALAVFTKRRSIFEKMLNDTAHGIVNWNVGTIGATGRLPFGGRKKSGNARPAALHAIRNSIYPVAVRHST